jgi:hypothetical protein
MKKYEKVKNRVNNAFLKETDRNSFDELFERHQLSIELDIPLEVQEEIRSETALAYLNKISNLIKIDSELVVNGLSNREKRSIIRGGILQLVEDCRSLIDHDDNKRKYMYN